MKGEENHFIQQQTKEEDNTNKKVKVVENEEQTNKPTKLKEKKHQGLAIFPICCQKK